MNPLLTIIVPAYNEARTIDELLARVLKSPFAMQIIVVDDASTDSTAMKLEAWPVTVLTHSANRGKGAAIRTGLDQAQGVYTLIQDADLEYDPQDYQRLLAPLLAGDADVVYGSRHLRWSIGHVGVSMLNRCVLWLYGVRLTDEATCYKVFRTDDLRAMDLQCDRFEFCPEVTAKVCRMGLRIVEVPISYTPRSTADGKKIRWRDGWVAIKTLWRWRKWSAANRSLASQRRFVERSTAKTANLERVAAALDDRRISF
jgi:glycosyltransferase involved in cell wall biosynthesis